MEKQAKKSGGTSQKNMKKLVRPPPFLFFFGKMTYKIKKHLKLEMMEKVKKSEKVIDETGVENLPPFKKSIAVFLRTGESPESLVERMAFYRKMLLRTAKAFVTMVEGHMAKINSSVTAKQKKEDNSIVHNLSPFKKIIAVALLSGEEPELLAVRLAGERNMPIRTAKAYVKMVQMIFESMEIYERPFVEKLKRKFGADWESVLKLYVGTQYHELINGTTK